MKTKIQLFLVFMCLAILVFCNRFVPPSIAAPDSYYYPSSYNLLGSTSYISGSLTDLQSDDEAYMTYQSYPSAFSAVTNTRAFIDYRSNSGTYLLNSPKERTWNGSTWNAGEAELPTSGSPVRFVRATYSTLSKQYDCRISVTLSDDGTLDAYVFNSTSWSVTNDLVDLWTTAPTGAQRPYDITFEKSSGNAILAYGWFDDGLYDLAYRIWFASNQSWSTQRLLDDPTHAAEADYSFVVLDNDKTSGSNYVGLIALDVTNSDALVGVWNGATWVNLTDLSTTVSITSEEDIGVAWAYDGSLMAVSGEGSNEVIRWNRWTKTSGWGTSSYFDMDTSQTLITNWITIKADPSTDDLMLIMVDSGSDLHSGYWSGSSWSITSNIDTSVDTNARRPADFDWEPSASKGLLVRGTTSGQITWKAWAAGAGWGADNNLVMGVYTHLWVQLKRNPRNVAGDTKILGAVLESTSNDLGAIKWDGTTFTVIGTSTFTADTTANTYECFDLEFRNFGDPTEFVSEVEFTGTSDTQSWTMLIWTVDTSWTASDVNTTIQQYNYQLAQYPTSGDGYASYLSSGTPNVDETKSQTITTDPTRFRDGSGTWRLKIKGTKATSTRFNFKPDLVQFETSLVDFVSPSWSNAGTNNTIAGQPTLFYAKWTDNIGLSGFIFGTNNTGTWLNDTWTPTSGTVSWSNVTKTLTNLGGKVVQWRIWANDTSNNWNNTGILSLRTVQLPVASFSYSPIIPYTNQNVAFNASTSYDPDGWIVSYFWTFGDGTNSTGVTKDHVFAENGVYTVTLTVTDNDGLIDSEIKSISVLNRPPIASFTESATTAPTGTPIFFNASSSSDPDGSIVNYFWTFGDGTNATGVTVSHAYADDGTYQVTLTVTDNDGSTNMATATKTITNRPPTASFTEDATTVYTGVAIHFNASDSFDPDGYITSYFWTFDDGANATGVIVAHIYAENGTYVVTLTITDNDGATSSSNSTKTVLNRPPVASFTESATTVYTNEAIYFNASASYDPDGSIVSYFWTFGDDTNATGVTASHAFSENGVYIVTLTVTDNDATIGSTTASKTVLNRLPVASFTESASTVLTGETIYFNASSSYDPDGSIANYFWTFGDGANASGQNVGHSYSNNGIYTVTLTVTDNDGGIGSSTASKTVLNRPPVASFTESASTVLTGEVIFFNASTSNDPDGIIVSYSWTFGDGTNATGAIVNHAYADNGIYVVTLTITDDDDATDSTSATKTVLNRPPIASFTESATTVYTGEAITFNASASYDPDGSIVSYFWTFGDGANSTGIIVAHSYAENGLYTVTLTITDNDGANAAQTEVKTVLNRLPVASFTESATTVNRGEVIYFNASASYDPDGSIASFFWDFGDGTNASGVITSHAYTNAGVYTVTLTVTDNDGGTATQTATKTVLNQAPVASFTESATTVYTGEAIYFNASASFDPDGSIVSYFWTFGEGANATGVTVSHSYSNNGVFTVTLVVTDNDGATASSTATKNVLNRAPTASFTESATTVLTGQTIDFNASASNDPDGSIVSYFWTFGDGTNASGITASHAYADDGTYTVSLTVTDDDDAASSTTAIKTVLNRPPVALFTESATTVYTDEIIYFNASGSYDSDGVIVSYFWSFGDGTNATGVDVSHAYGDNGVYVVNLTVTDNDGATAWSTATKSVLNRAPVALFTESATTVYTGEAIYFNASSSYDPDGSLVSYVWTFGDGSNASGITANHAYANSGVYTVTLTVTDNDGANATSTATKTILNRLPVASFTESASTVYTDEVIYFNASSSYDPDGSIIGYFWNFGDGTNATGVTVNHSYGDDGTYAVVLTVTDDDGATATANATKNVLNRPPIANFTESATTVYTGQAITFNASNSYDRDGVIVSYAWNFGDGNITTVTTPNISHAYADNGTYTVTLTVTDDDGATASTSATKIVLNRDPVASFAYLPPTPYTSQIVTFNASSSYDPDGIIASYQWNFGDGNVTTVTSPIIIHAYIENAAYNVTLTVTDNDAATATASSSITVLNRLPVASFTESATTVYTGVVINFNATASNDPDGSIASYFWTFGDGTNATGVAADHAYVDDGVYTVTLTVTDNDGGTGMATATKTVLNRLPVASFTENATTVLTGVAIHFDASGSHDPDGTITSYFWTFGDGTNATGMVVDHAYLDNGIYTVTLTVTDNDGGTAASNATKTVLNRPPGASFTESATTVYTGEVIYFNASSSSDSDGTIVGYFWSFGDGANATGITASHSYSDTGTYTVTLTVTDDDGETGSQNAVKTVLNRPPVAFFTESAETVVVGQVIYFNASQSYDPDGNIVSFFWNFGDGTNATGVTTQHAYSDNGIYTVALTVTDNDGATATSSAIKTVSITPPVAIFTESAETVYTNEIIRFNASASYDPDGFIIGYFWTFGDGTNATGVIVEHAYSENGVYTATLTVTDDDGATGTANATKTVLNRLPVANFAESATTVFTDDVIYFNASASYDPDGAIVVYFWDFGDGTNASGVTVAHAYTDDGTYVVTLTVTDNDGGTTPATATKTVLNRAPVASFTESATTVYTGEVIYFNASASYDLDGTIVIYFWTFGDGTNATGALVNHAYADNGTYTATLTVTDDDGATSSQSATKTVLNRPPVASFSESATTVLTNEVIFFNASDSYDSDGDIVSFFWDFGDNANATGITAQHAYIENGTYTVTLTVTDNDGAAATATATKYVQNRPPVAAFTYSPSFPIVGQAVTFDASISFDPDGSIISYQWDFGDGNVTASTAPTIIHIYNGIGNYTVTLSVTDNDGNTVSTTQTVPVREYPTASFIYSPSFPLTGETVDFDASSSDPNGGSIISYEWDFDDGTPPVNTSSPFISHAYSSVGNYTVILTVTDSEGLNDTTSHIVGIRGYPIAAFTFTPSYPVEGEAVTFNASASTPNGGVITGYYWSFGDGNTANLTGPVATHAYLAIGNYTATLTITDSEGLNSSQSRFLSVRGYPTAAFTYTPTVIYVGDTLTLNASLSSSNGGVIVSYLWDFGDGSPQLNTTDTLAAHVYTSFGNHSVTLKVTDSEGLSDTDAQVVAVGRAPVAVFTYSPKFPKVGETATFNASGSYDPNGYIMSYTWDFDDGNVTTVATPIVIHAYTSTGVYTVTLTVTDNSGYTDIATALLALGSPKASFSYTPKYAIAWQLITFNASTSYDPNGYIVSYVWNFGDGNITTVATPIANHAYSTDGNYTVTLTVADNQGLTDTISQTISIGKAPVASFTFTPAPSYVGDTVTFNASSSTPSGGDIAYYLWNFGDGSLTENKTTPITTHVYGFAGTYTVSLTIKDTMGLSNTATKSLTALQSPIANFDYSPQYPQAFDVVTFNASGSYDANGYIVSYVWNFGDGNVTAVTTPVITHVYGVAGNYTVVLIVADNAGYTHATSRSLFVSMRPPVASFTHTPDSPIAGQTVTFNASNSYDLDGAVVSYKWSFGDGNTTTVTSALVIHTYTTYGNYTVTLTVTDDDNLTNAETAVVRVKGYPSAAFTYAPSIPDVGGTVTFDASSSTPNGGVIANYLWNFGDGSPQTNTTDPTVTHVFGTSGNYTVTLTLTDTEGLSDTETKAVYVAELPAASFTFSPASPYVGDTVMFNASLSYDADGYIVGYSWDFRDGTPLVNETDPLTTHIYAMGGAYSVMLTVTDNMGLQDTTTVLVNIGEAPSALFTYSPGFPIASEIVTFDASSSYDVRRSIANYTWNFGDGNITVVTVNAINHAYVDEGAYPVSLTVTDIGGYADTTTQIVSVRNYPIANFAFAPSYPVRAQEVTFDATYSTPEGGTITSYLWDFGDGTPKLNTTSPILKHAFASVGSYNVTLTVADSEGLTSTVVKTLKVRDYPTPNFTWTPPSPIATQSITFNASSSQANSGVITGYMWELGDGTIKTGATPIIAYSYSKANDYTVKLTITNSEGLSSSISKTVTVLDAPPSASFMYSPAIPIMGQSTTFNASASNDPDGAIVGYTWNFGDGNITVTTSSIIHHIYATTGNFTVTLIVRDDAGLEDAYSRNVKVITYPTANFVWSPSVPGSTQSVVFDASASTANSGSIVRYTWNFGDGNTTTVTVATIVHQYGIKGNYTVSLTVTNTEGLSNSKSMTITVVGTPPSADFTWQPLMPQPGETVTFDASSSAAKGGIIKTYVWDFGDGTPPILVIYKTSVTHKFVAIGEYTVTLNVTDTEELSATKSKAVRVVSPPTASFTWTPQTPKAYETTVFDASTSLPNGGTITTYRWDFGDGNVTTVFDATVVHVYTMSGNYVATLTITDSEGLSDSTSKSVSVSSATSPKADFSYLPSSPYVFEITEFDASASIPGTGAISSYVWDFGDGNITTLAIPFIAHAYDTSGNFSVLLTVENSAGLSNTKSKLVTVLGIGGPIANFTWSPLVPPPDKPIAFDASSSTLGWNGTVHPLIASWRWDFGDGNVTLISESIVIHTYNTSGDYAVTLIVTDINGSTSSLTRIVKVTSLLGDLNGDGKVDIKDVAIVAKAYGSYPGAPNWNPIADLNGDGKVDIKDVAIVAKQYGKTLSYLTPLNSAAWLTSTPFQLFVTAVTSLFALVFACAGEALPTRKKRYCQPRFLRIEFFGVLAS